LLVLRRQLPVGLRTQNVALPARESGNVRIYLGHIYGTSPANLEELSISKQPARQQHLVRNNDHLFFRVNGHLIPELEGSIVTSPRRALRLAVVVPPKRRQTGTILSTTLTPKRTHPHFGNLQPSRTFSALRVIKDGPLVSHILPVQSTAPGSNRPRHLHLVQCSTKPLSSLSLSSPWLAVSKSAPSPPRLIPLFPGNHAPPLVVAQPNPPERSSSTPTGAGSTRPLARPTATPETASIPHSAPTARLARLTALLMVPTTMVPTVSPPPETVSLSNSSPLRPRRTLVPVSTSWPATPLTRCSSSSTRNSPLTSMFPTFPVV
jgi:hypothetical protein